MHVFSSYSFHTEFLKTPSYTRRATLGRGRGTGVGTDVQSSCGISGHNVKGQAARVVTYIVMGTQRTHNTERLLAFRFCLDVASCKVCLSQEESCQSPMDCQPIRLTWYLTKSLTRLSHHTAPTLSHWLTKS